MVPIVSIVGNSDSGKTTLIERLIPTLKAKGYKVGTIKHDAHHFDIDHEGKDTWRMTNSGADTVLISSRDKMALIKQVEEEKSLDDIAEWFYKDVDIIITEGYKASDKPKIEVIRHRKIISNPENNLIALVKNASDETFYPLVEGVKDILTFHIEDIDCIADFIEKRFLTKRG